MWLLKGALVEINQDCGSSGYVGEVQQYWIVLMICLCLLLQTAAHVHKAKPPESTAEFS